jgi:hypothetical protein
MLVGCEADGRYLLGRWVVCWVAVVSMGGEGYGGGLCRGIARGWGEMRKDLSATTS